MGGVARRLQVSEFAVYVVLVAALAVAAVLVLPWVTEWRVNDPVLLVVLSAFVLAGELLPVPVPRRRGLARVTISAAFAFAILLRFGPGVAALVVRRELGDRRRHRARVPAQDPLQRGAVSAGDRRRGRGADAGQLAADRGDHGLRVADRARRGGCILRHQPRAGVRGRRTAGACSDQRLSARRSRVPGVDRRLRARIRAGAAGFRGRERRARAGVLRADARRLLRRARGRALESPGAPRRADGPSEPIVHVGDAPGGAGRRRSRAPSAGGDAARPRRLQVDQRHARPRAWGPDAAAGRAAAAPGGRRVDRARADRRRRVRGAGRRPPGGRRGARQAAARGRSTIRSRWTRWPCTSARAWASPASRSMGAPRPS